MQFPEVPDPVARDESTLVWWSTLSLCDRLELADAWAAEHREDPALAAAERIRATYFPSCESLELSDSDGFPEDCYEYLVAHEIEDLNLVTHLAAEIGQWTTLQRYGIEYSVSVSPVGSLLFTSRYRIEGAFVVGSESSEFGS